MKKQLLFIACLVGFTYSAHAQSSMFQMGIKGAFNYSNLKSEDDRWLSSDNKTGYQIGIWTRIGNVVHVQPELYLTGRSSEAQFEFNDQDIRADVSFTSLELPVLLGSRVGIGNVGLRFQAGPMVSFVVDKSVGDALGQIIDVDSYKDNSFSLIGGVGLDLGKFRADLRYEHAMSSLVKDQIPEQTYSAWSVGVGLRLF
ncbi:MAG TPA: porin family protein [Sphingobacteriaceae bacterium]|nr:porin family protein [Sphingobacteriaceae bacterium]